MNNEQAFAKGREALIQGKELMVFDWHKAARLIVEKRPFRVYAGLAEDWEWTGGEIYHNIDGEDEPVLTPKPLCAPYLASSWAIPEIDIDDIIEDCFVMQSDSPNGEWNSQTLWPESAIRILKDAKERNQA